MMLPGEAVGAGRSVTGGPERFPGVIAPDTDFSVGDTGAVAVGFDDGAFSAGFSFVPQAVNIPMPSRAVAPAASTS